MCAWGKGRGRARGRRGRGGARERGLLTHLVGYYCCSPRRRQEVGGKRERSQARGRMFRGKKKVAE
eukprot:scaffold119834_cov23-Tisochrysis_lutea.AAC.1